MRILVLTKRQYTQKDLIDDRYGRIREIPLNLARIGHSVEGICLSYRARREGIFLDEKVKWHSINAGRLLIPGLMRFIFSAFRCARRVDVIWACSDSIYGIIGYAVARICRKKIIFDLYDNFEYFFFGKLPLLNSLYHYVLRHADAVICVSEPLKKMVLDHTGRTGDVYIIENGIPGNFFYALDKKQSRQKFGLPTNAKLIGTGGALTKNRGIIHLFTAFNQLKMAYPDLHLVLAGYKDVIIPADERIHYVGILDYGQMPLFFATLDTAIICNSNNAFGKYCFPQKAHELMACDVPIVAAKTRGVQAIFKDRPEWMFQPDDPDDLVKAVTNRLSNPATDYHQVPTWADLAKKMDRILSKFTLET